jgi:hypothetical protein
MLGWYMEHNPITRPEKVAIACHDDPLQEWGGAGVGSLLVDGTSLKELAQWR